MEVRRKDTSPVVIEFRDSTFIWSDKTGIISILRDDARNLAKAIQDSLASSSPLLIDIAGEKLFFNMIGKGNYGEFARTKQGMEFQSNRVDLQKIAEELDWLAGKVPTPDEFVHFHLEPTLMSGNDTVDDFVFELKESDNLKGCKEMDPCDLTFNDLDGRNNFTEEIKPDSALEIWYLHVRNIPFKDMESNDIGRICRQLIYLEECVPCFLERLKADPLQGNEWRGELAEALTYVPTVYWERHPDQLEQFIPLLNQAYFATEDEDLDWNGEMAIYRRNLRNKG